MKILALVLSLLLIAATSFTAFAHSGEARIELNVTQTSPGATIEVRGSGFEPDDHTTIMLVSANQPQLLGSATADADGNLAQAVLLPMDVADGQYEVRVMDMHHVAGATLHILTDLNGDEAGSQRAEEEPLLAPMPKPTGITTPANTAATLVGASPSAAAAPAVSPALLLLAGPALVVLVAGLAVVSRRSQ